MWSSIRAHRRPWLGYTRSSCLCSVSGGGLHVGATIARDRSKRRPRPEAHPAKFTDSAAGARSAILHARRLRESASTRVGLASRLRCRAEARPISDHAIPKRAVGYMLMDIRSIMKSGLFVHRREPRSHDVLVSRRHCSVLVNRWLACGTELVGYENTDVVAPTSKRKTVVNAVAHPHRTTRIGPCSHGADGSRRKQSLKGDLHDPACPEFRWCHHRPAI